KEEMIGLLAAVERYLKLDHEAERRELERRVSEVLAVLAPIPGLRARSDVPEIANHVPHVVLDWDDRAGRPSPRRVAGELIEVEPPIAGLPEGDRGLRVSVWMMRGDEHRTVARRLKEILGPG